MRGLRPWFSRLHTVGRRLSVNFRLIRDRATIDELIGRPFQEAGGGVGGLLRIGCQEAKPNKSLFLRSYSVKNRANYLHRPGEAPAFQFRRQDHAETIGAADRRAGTPAGDSIPRCRRRQAGRGRPSGGLFRPSERGQLLRREDLGEGGERHAEAGPGQGPGKGDAAAGGAGLYLCGGPAQPVHRHVLRPAGLRRSLLWPLWCLLHYGGIPGPGVPDYRGGLCPGGGEPCPPATSVPPSGSTACRFPMATSAPPQPSGPPRPPAV